MKTGVHPEYRESTASCSCGSTFQFRTTLEEKKIRLDVCDQCHPFYTGRQRIVDTGGRVGRFQRRFGALEVGKE